MRTRDLLFVLPLMSACGLGSEQDPGVPEVKRQSVPIVNGREIDTPEFQAVVSISGPGGVCTGTFIHPHFVLTAAHCTPVCPDSITAGCADASNEVDIVDGDAPLWRGRDGALGETRVCLTADACTNGGSSLAADRVFYPIAAQFNPREAPPDIALFHTVLPFGGRIINVFPAADIPTPQNLCSRYELTRPTIAGFSTNEGANSAFRRIGVAEVECDLEVNGRAFKVDGHGRPFRGSRGCRGDSGGPALWRDASQALVVGGVMSYTDTFPNACPSERGETGIAFIPRSFIDAVVPVLTVRRLGSGGAVTAPGGLNCTLTDGPNCTLRPDFNAQVTLTAVPGAGNLFTGWSGACSGTASTCTLTVVGATNVTATFAAVQQPLTVTVSPTGVGHRVSINGSTLCSGTCVSHFNFGTSVSLVALPATEHVFARWEGSCAGHTSATCNLTMTAARTARPVFCPQDDACCINPGPTTCTSCDPVVDCPPGKPFCCDGP